MMLFKKALLFSVVLSLGAALAFAVGALAREPGPGDGSATRPAAGASVTPGHGRSPSPSPTATSPTADPTTSPTHEPAFRIASGDQGLQVRELQSRLSQIAWLPETVTGTFDDATKTAVEGFQAKRGIKSTGVVDQRTWGRLVAMTEQPTHDAMFNILHPGPALLAPGDSGTRVRDLQARLKAIAWYFGDVTGSYDAQTIKAVRGFQDKRDIPVTGKVDQRTLDRLHAMTSEPTHDAMHNVEPKAGALDPRCETGRVLCIDKSSRTLRWVVDGKVLKTMDARFGSTVNNTPTREGVFHVYVKDIDHVSHEFGSAMPFSMFFSGGQAVHYSSDFATYGYYHASHGCVNIRDYDGLKWLFSQVRVGDKVVVYWS